jgi:type I restriction enzyme, S subunit
VIEGRWDLPEHWKWLAARDVGEIVGGGTPSTGDSANFANKGIPWITPADLTGYPGKYISRGTRDLSEKGYSSSGAKLMPPGTVLFSSRAPIGYCVIASNELATNQGFKSLVSSSEHSPEYLRYYLLSAKEYAESLASGTTFKELSGARMANLAIPVPPFPEQCRIVVKLDRLTGRTARARDELGRIPRLIQKYRESVIASGLSGAWTGDGAKGGWTDCKAKELFTWSSGKFLPKSKQANGRIPVYGGNGINGTHDRALVNLPTIVVGRVGAQCGNVYLTGGPAWITDNAIFAQTTSERVDPRFALLVLRHSNLNAQSGGTGQPYVNQENLNDVEFCLPSLREQHSILKRIETAFAWLDRVAAEHANASRHLPKLDQVILAKAFRGELVLSDGQSRTVAAAES